MNNVQTTRSSSLNSNNGDWWMCDVRVVVERLATVRKWYALGVCISMVAKFNGFYFEVLYIVIRRKSTPS